MKTLRSTLIIAIAVTAAVFTGDFEKTPPTSGPAESNGTTPPATTTPPTRQDPGDAQPLDSPPAGLSMTEWDGVRAQIRAEQRAFHDGTAGNLHATGPRGEHLRLSPDGTATFSLGHTTMPADLNSTRDEVVATAMVSSDHRPASSLSLRGTGIGREGSLRQLSGAVATATERHHAERIPATGIIEWWRSEERGFEFGWNVETRPAGEGNLVVEMAVDCPWPGAAGPSGSRIAFTDPSGSGWRLVCEDLIAKDAAGKTLPAEMQLAANTLTIRVDDAGAQYPVVIDPWIVAESPLLVYSPTPVASGDFGRGVTLKGDVLLIAEDDSGSIDTLYLFTRSGTGYTLRRTLNHLIRHPHPARICGDTVVAGPFLGFPEFHYLSMERNQGGTNAWGTVQNLPVTLEDTSPGAVWLGQLVLALGPDYLVLGDSEDEAGPGQGRVRFYERDPVTSPLWTLTGQVTAADVGAEWFGFQVVSDGPVLVVAGVLPDTKDLIQYVFRRHQQQWTLEKAVPVQGFSLLFSLPTLAVSGETMAVGLPGEPSVRLYERDAGGANQWGLVRTLTEQAGSLFGASMCLEGDLLVVGAPQEDLDHDGNPLTPDLSSAGVIHSYQRHAGGINAWGETGSLHKAAAAQSGDDYGRTLSLDCGRLAVGFDEADSTAPVLEGSGVVEIHTLSSGIDFRFTVASPLIADNTEFGSAVALDGPYLLVGAPNFDPVTPGAASGAAFLFRDRTLVKSWYGDSPGDRFGQAVALDRDRVAIGAPMRAGSVGGTAFGDLGTVYIYERNQGGVENWGEVKALTPPSVYQFSPSPQFGSSVALGGDRLVVGSPAETSLVFSGFAGSGRARVFQRNSGGSEQWGQEKFLYGDNSSNDELFGFTVDISGDTVVAGAPGEEIGGHVSAGGAYVFRRNQGGGDNWGRVTRLTAPTPATLTYFGGAVALDGNNLAIGAPRENRGGTSDAGAVYLYSTGHPSYDHWSLDARLQPDELVSNQLFGQSIGLSHGRVFIGGANAGATEPSAAAAWLFSKTGDPAEPWTEEGVLTTSDPDSLGTSVAIDGTHLIAGDPTADVFEGGSLKIDRGEVYDWVQVGKQWMPLRSASGNPGAADLGASLALIDDLLMTGAPGESVGGNTDAGAVYVFRKDDLSSGGWDLVQRLTDPDGSPANARFGASLAADTQWLVAGSPGARRAAMFTRGTVLVPDKPWTGMATLSASPAQTDEFGASVAIADSRALVGAPQRSGGGAAYLFERNEDGADQWAQIDTLVAGDAAAGDAFGTSVALQAGIAVVGAPLDDNTAGSDAGSVYVFSRNLGGADAWGQVKKLNAVTQAAGDELGTSVALADYLVLAGMPGANTPAGTGAGAALLFARNFGGAEAYGLLKTFTAPDGSAQSRFGTAVALDTSHALVTAPFADPGGRSNAGGVYVYSRNYGGIDTWGLLQASAPQQLPAASQFGMAVALDRSTFAVGAPFAPAAGSQGLVEIYSFRALTHYDEWAAAWGLYGAAAEPDADGDGNGQKNIIEYFFGTDPGDPNDMGALAHQIDGGNMIVTFPKACSCEGIGVLTAELSSDLVTWTPAGPVDILQDTASLLQIQVPVTVPGRRFVRFRAEVP